MEVPLLLGREEARNKLGFEEKSPVASQQNLCQLGLLTLEIGTGPREPVSCQCTCITSSKIQKCHHWMHENLQQSYSSTVEFCSNAGADRQSQNNEKTPGIGSRLS